MKIEELSAAWLAARQAEADANAKRLEIEQQILQLIPPREEGSMSTELQNGWKVRTSGKMIYSGDIDRLLELTRSWPEKPVKSKLELDTSMLRAIRSDRPDLWRAIAPAITVKPAKTGVNVEVPDGL